MSEEERVTRSSDIVHLGDEEATTQVLAQAVLGLWEVVNAGIITSGKRTRRLNRDSIERIS